MRKNTIGFFFLLFALALYSCKEKPTETKPVETKIIGRISEKSSNNPLGGAVVSTSPVTSSVTTDGSGNYTISNVGTGQYVVTATKDGYKFNSTTVSAKEGETSSADIQLEQLTPVLTISAATIDFGITQNQAIFTISNSTQYGTLQWSITKNADWLSVSPTSGTVTTGTSTITLTANRVGLAYGNYSTILNVTSNGGNKDIPITLTVQNPNAPQLTVSPLSLDFGQTTTSMTFSINNTGTGKLTWSISSPQSWITVTPVTDSTRTETDLITVQVNRTSLSSGSYTGQIQVVSNAGTQTISVQLSVPNQATLLLSTTQLDFGSTLNNLTFTISNSGTGNLNWTISSDKSWLTVNPTSGTNQATVNVYVNRSGLSAGGYTGTLSISSNGGSGSVNVAMSVPTASNPTAVTLNTPTNITTTSVDLSWTQNTDTDFKQYEVHKSTTSGFTPSSSTLVQTITTKTTTSTTISGLSSATTYYFKVRIVNTSNLFSDSNERNATTNSATTGPYTTDANTIGLWHFDETGGNTVADASGNGNNGTASGTTIVIGKFSNGRKFDGSQDIVSIPISLSSPLNDEMSSFTFEGWIYLNTMPYGGQTIIYKRNMVMVSAGDNQLICEKSNGGSSYYRVDAENVLVLRQWFHFAFTYDGSQLRIYINGILKAMADATGTVGSAGGWDMYLGEYYSASPWNGMILDEVRISNKARNPSEFHLSKH